MNALALLQLLSLQQNSWIFNLSRIKNENENLRAELEREARLTLLLTTQGCTREGGRVL